MAYFVFTVITIIISRSCLCVYGVSFCTLLDHLVKCKVRKHGSRRGNSTPQFPDCVKLGWISCWLFSLPRGFFTTGFSVLLPLQKSILANFKILKTAASDALVFLFLRDGYILFNTCCVSICSMYYLQRLLITFYTVLLTGVVQTSREKHNVYAC